MTRDELIEKIEYGSDIMFDVCGRHFTILTWTDNGISIGEQYPNDGELEQFETAEALVDGFVVNGKTLAELADSVVITDYS